jgi:hypothetical protein
MTTLGFPIYTAGTNVGATYTLNGVTYTWNGYAWYKTNQGPINATTVTGGTIIIGTGTQTVIINGGNISINGSNVLTTSSLISAFSSGTDISIRYSTITQSIVISDTSTFQTVTNRGATTTNIVTFANTTNSVSTISGAVVVTGGVGIGGDVYMAGTLNAEHIQIAHAVFDTSATIVTTALPALIDSYPVTQFRSAKYLVQIDDTNNNSYQVSELLMLVANTGTGWYGTSLLEYGINTNGGEIGQFSSQVNTATNPPTAELYITMYGQSYKTVQVLRTAITP